MKTGYLTGFFFITVLFILAAVNAQDSNTGKGLDFRIVLKIQEGKEKKPVSDTQLQYQAWHLRSCDSIWYNAAQSPEDQTNKVLSGQSFSTLGDDAGKLKGKQFNYSARIRLLLTEKQKHYARAKVRIIKKGYHSAYFWVDYRKLGPEHTFYKEVTIKPHQYAAINFYAKIQKYKDTKALPGTKFQYEWEGEWHDVEPSAHTKEPGAALSKGVFSVLGEDAGTYKGKEVNYTCSARIPFGKSKQRNINLRVFREKFEPYYFTIRCSSTKNTLEDLRNVVLKAHELVGNWQLNEGAGDVVKDASGKSNPGRILGPVWVKDNGRSVLRFDGKDDVVDCGRHRLYETKEAITMLLWIKPEDNTDIMQGIAGRAWRNPYGLYTTKDNGLEAAFFIEGYGYINVTGRDVLKAKEWNMVGVTYNGYACARLFHNGNKVRELNINRVRHLYGTKPHGMYVPSSQPLSIGYFNGVAPFKGLIRNVRIYNYVLEENEVKKIYEKEK